MNYLFTYINHCLIQIFHRVVEVLFGRKIGIHFWIRRFALLGAVMGSLFLPACGKTNTLRSPEIILKEAWEQYRIGEFAAALKLFHLLRESNPIGSEYHVQGLYGEGTCWNYRRDGRDVKKAVEAYNAVLQLAPQHALAGWSALEIVQATHLDPADDSADPSELINGYSRLYKDYPKTLAGEQAFLYQCNLQLPGLDLQHASKLLEEINAFFEMHPKTIFKSMLDRILAECCNKLGRQDERLRWMIESLDTGDGNVPNPNAAGIYWNIAYAAEFEAGNFAVAREYYHRFLNEYPRDVRVFAVRVALKRMDTVETAIKNGTDVSPYLDEGVSQ